VVQFEKLWDLNAAADGVNLDTMPRSKMPPHLVVDYQGVQRCSVCQMPFSRETNPLLDEAFEAHALKAHQPGQTSEDVNQAAEPIARHTKD